MATASENAKGLFIGLLLTGVLLGGISGVLFWVGAEEKNVVPTLFASAGSLGTVLLFGFSIKNLVTWLSA